PKSTSAHTHLRPIYRPTAFKNLSSFKDKLYLHISCLGFPTLTNAASEIVQLEKMRPIFCGNFEYDARQSDLERIFGKYGKVDRVDMKSGWTWRWNPLSLSPHGGSGYILEKQKSRSDPHNGTAIIHFPETPLPSTPRHLCPVFSVRHQERGGRRSAGSRRSSANMRPTKTLFVINFDPIHTRTRDLERHFDPYGKILNIRIRRNFAFIQFESQEDATKALDATNMSKLMDRVISVEYAVRDDDEKRDGHSPDRRGRGRSPDRSHDRRRSPSPYERERGSPDYGRGASPVRRSRDRVRSRSPYERERGSPDYGRGGSPVRRSRDHVRSPSPYRREMGSFDNGRGASPVKRSRDRMRSPSPVKRSRDRVGSPSPYPKERGSPDNGHGASPERRSLDRVQSPSPYRRERGSPDNGRGSPERSGDRVQSPGPYDQEQQSPEYDGEPSPKNNSERRGSPGYRRTESPVSEKSHRSATNILLCVFCTILVDFTKLCEKMRAIFCGNFELGTRQSDLERLFSKYGKVERVDMKSDGAGTLLLQERGGRRSGGSRSSGNSRPTKTLFVINFDPMHTRTRDLEKHFDPYGKIMSIRIRRNFAFVQYDSQEDATKALDATNMSKLMDQVVSVEYAVRDDDGRNNRHSPDRRSRGRSIDRGHDRRGSPSPHRRQRDSPDYGHGLGSERGRDRARSPSPHRGDRYSPDYGRGPSPNGKPRSRAYQRGRRSPDDGHGPSPDVKPEMRGRMYRRDSPNVVGGLSPDIKPELRSHTYRRDSPDVGRGSSPNSEYEGRGNTRGQEIDSDFDHGASPPHTKPELRGSPKFAKTKSPIQEKKYRRLAIFTLLLNNVFLDKI
ncbi:hypothetical protein IFM89_035092, partial [Coptis chinensis]